MSEMLFSKRGILRKGVSTNSDFPRLLLSPVSLNAFINDLKGNVK